MVLVFLSQHLLESISGHAGFFGDREQNIFGQLTAAVVVGRGVGFALGLAVGERVETPAILHRMLSIFCSPSRMYPVTVSQQFLESYSGHDGSSDDRKQ
jgi:hypothetical protein